ncbi:DUF1289 domain-containing protein [Halomonas sp. YLGW01]|uniref:DUF1289 domain-containing protein n=1 Tax=Halomonas sp. YLGW01 TaxID=2773308 RepID=UPI00177D1E22|nr:DUF1289 domain-containing protein [Halomonas sp. YLGW01]
MTRRIISPCVGLCSTTVGDDVCRGCQRHADEIRDWPAYESEERDRRLADLDALREEVAAELLRVVDAGMLKAQLERHGIRHRTDQPALSQAVELLRVGRDRIRDLSRYGLETVAEGRDLTPAELHARLVPRLMAAAEARREASG